jgi:DNA polymerase V
MNHFVLVDCNNFYVSSERLFNPNLEGKAVLVLSNNDGCVIARSQEAKQLGIKMGEPFFKVKDLCKTRNVIIFSSNYQLYGDLSQRVMHILSEQAPDMQVYSIDEAFLTFPSEMDINNLFTHCLEIRRIIKKWVGIPTSIGMGPTKTLAKMANALAKKDCRVGVFNLNSKAVQEDVLKEFPVGDVWGIGSKLKAKLNTLGIYTAWEFCQQDPSFIRKKMGVVGERLLWELRGLSCLPLEETSPKKSITCSRSFGKALANPNDLAEAIANYANTACIKLRQQKCCTSALCVYLEVVLDIQTGLRQHFSTTNSFSFPTNDTPQVINLAKKSLMSLFQPEKRYKKCGIILLDLIPENLVSPDFFLGSFDPKRRQLAEMVDTLNARFGKNTLFYGSMGIDPSWKMRCERRSKHYTTSWQELAVVKAN